MKSQSPIKNPFHADNAFSMVEVVLAIGIVAFALLSIIGIFGGVVKSSTDNADRREIAEAIDSLRAYLNSTEFSTVYDWVRLGTNFIYVSYRTSDPESADATPDPTGNSINSVWLPGDADIADYDAARTGHLLKARLRLSPSNPGGTNLPSLNAYPYSSIFALAQIDAVSSPNQELPQTPQVQATMAIRR